MNIKLLMIVLFVLSQVPATCQNFYQLQSCKIDFAFGLPSYKGTMTIIFSDSGNIMKVTGVKKYDNIENSSDKNNGRTAYNFLNIQTIDSVYSIDLDSMFGYKRVVNKQDRTNFFANEKGRTIRVDTFLNKKCEVKDLNGIIVWLWKGIALKKEYPTFSKSQFYEYATSIQEDYEIKKDEFKVPKGIDML